jgi:ATP-dependent exoDNAse (exonuclease V) beta subunit
MTPPPDQAQRDAAISERQRNVVVDAGAGTGKTTLLVSRLIQMVAPTNDARAAIDIGRIAAVTFTLKAAGELRLRIRERLLSELSSAKLSVVRRDRLRAALDGLDTAHIGTVHAFADRLLRRHPVKARLSPAYDVIEDEDQLLRETHDTLVTVCEAETLPERLTGCPSATRAAEAQVTVTAYLRAGLRPVTLELEYTSFFGLDAIVAGLIRGRDIPLADPPAPRFMREVFQKAAKAASKRLADASGDHHPGRWLRRQSEELRALAAEEDPVAILPRLLRMKKGAPKNATLKDDFRGDKESWAVWKAWKEGVKGKKAKKGEEAEEDQESLEKAVTRPVHRWMARRLVRLSPVVLDLYEQVKERHRAVDQIDLLVKLRNLLRDDLSVRAEYQGLFDHLFIDEFQDTDPLQAEIALFLCERTPQATRWQDVILTAGRLTIVGDPKQSIYRFRRADVRMYSDVRALVGVAALSVTLSASFRARPPLVDYLNERFNDVLGVPDGQRIFDPEKGSVANQNLDKGRTEAAPSKGTPASPPVRILQLASDDPDTKADGWREIEARALARYLRWLVGTSGISINDPSDGTTRPVRYGDIAVLAVATTTLRGLFDEFDTMGVPHVSRGGTLFLRDPLHRQFLLGLRAIADRDDGVAEAALLRPPFFAVDLADLAHARAIALGATTEPSDGAARAEAARAWLQDVRKRRFSRSPGDTARTLLEETGFGRFIALGPNGTQRLARLREMCLLVEQKAASERLDYDSVTEQLRSWVDGPVPLDPPPAVGVDAVQVLTVHQAKGLEFPVVVLWDSRAGWLARNQGGAWRVDRDGQTWLLKLADLQWNEPEDQDLVGREGDYLDQERKRIIYVAATRACDLLVLPTSEVTRGQPPVNARLASVGDASLVQAEEPYLDSRLPAWALAATAPVAPALTFDKRTEDEVGARWTAAAVEAVKDRFTPTAVRTEADARVRARKAAALPGDGAEDELVAPRKERTGRFGPIFGTTVHLAIGMCLSVATASPAKAVARAAAQSGLTENLEAAVADVVRALKALANAGMGGVVGRELFVEYPLAAGNGAGKLVRGYADLVHVSETEIRIVDFKTDAANEPTDATAFPDYVEQVRTYAGLVGPVAGGRLVSAALLFTGTGRMVIAT